MTQKLVSLGGRPLDFGLVVVFTAAGVRLEGRADSATYKGPLFDQLAPIDVVVTDVADNYEMSSPRIDVSRLDAGAQRIAMVRGRAAELDKKKKYSEASALRATIGE